MPWELPITIEDTTYPVRFNTEAEPSQADIDEAVAYITQQRSSPASPAGPPDSGQGRTSSFLSSVGRGAASIVPGVIGGAGYLTGSDTLTGAANDIEAGINRALPVNPAYEDEFLMKAGQALGQVVPMIVTGGAAGAVGKSMALARGLEAGAAAAKGTQLAGRVMLGSAMLQGTRGGGQAAEQYGMEGGAAYARALLGGAIEGATERYLFGMGSELSPIGRMLGTGGTPGATILRAAGTEGVEEGAAEVGGNLATTALAPSGVQTPGMFANAGEATALGAIAGGAMGGFNAMLSSGETPTTPAEEAIVQTVEGSLPAPIVEAGFSPEMEARLSAVEKALTPTAVSPVATLTQDPEETMDAFIGRLNAQQAQLEQGLRDFAAETAAANVDVLPATAAALQEEAPKETLDQVKARLRASLEQEIAAQETPVGALESEASEVLLPEDAVVEDQSQKDEIKQAKEWALTLLASNADIAAAYESSRNETPFEGAFVEGELSADDYGEDPYIYRNEFVNPEDFRDILKLEGLTYEQVVQMPSTQRYIQWYKEGKQPPPIDVVIRESDSRRYANNRRRVVAALEAGVTSIPARVEIGKASKVWKTLSQSNREPTPIVEETVPPEQPVPAVEEAPTPPLPQDQFQKTENVVAPAGEAEVGLGMDKLTSDFDTLFPLLAKQPRTLSAMRDRVIAKMDELESTPALPIYGSLSSEEKNRNFKKNELRDAQFKKLNFILGKIEAEKLMQSKGHTPFARPAKRKPATPWGQDRPTVEEAKAYLTEQLGPEPTTAEHFKDKTLDVDGWWRAIASEERNGTPRGRALVNAAIEWKQLKADEARQEAILAEERAKETPAAQAPTPEPAPPVQRDVTKPEFKPKEQQNPDEYLADFSYDIALARAERDNTGKSLKALKKEGREAYEKRIREQLRQSHVDAIKIASGLDEDSNKDFAGYGMMPPRNPVSKAAVDAYGITLPEGYVQDGELYVYRPSGTVEAKPAPPAKPAPEPTVQRDVTKPEQMVLTENPPPAWMSQGAIDEAIASLKPSGIIALPKSAYQDIPENITPYERQQYVRQIESWASRANDLRRGLRVEGFSPQQSGKPPVGSVEKARDDRGTKADAGVTRGKTITFPDVSSVPAFKRFQALFGTDIQSAVKAGFITEEKSFASKTAGSKLKVTGYSLRDGREFTSAAEAMKAYLAKAPDVSAKQVEISGITLPEGYVQDGELYVYRPSGTVEAKPEPTPKEPEYISPKEIAERFAAESERNARRQSDTIAEMEAKEAAYKPQVRQSGAELLEEYKAQQKAKPAPPAKPAAQSIADRLRAATSRAEAQEIVDSATHDQLKAAATELNYTPKGTKKEIASRLVASVGSRADALAIRDAGRPAQPPAPQPKQTPEQKAADRRAQDAGFKDAADEAAFEKRLTAADEKFSKSVFGNKPPAKPAAEVETPVAGVPADKISILKKEVDDDSGEINYHVGIPKDAAYALGLAGAWSQLDENGRFILRSGYARNPRQALDALLWRLKDARSKVLMPTMDAQQEYMAKMEAIEAPVRTQLSELFRPLIKEPLNKELSAKDAKGEPAIWLDDQIITPEGKYHFDSNGKLRKDQDLSKAGFEKNLDTVMSADGEGVLWGANKAAKAEIKRIQDERTAKKAAEAQAVKEKAEKDAQEQADKAAYAEAVEAVVLPKGKKQSIGIKDATGAVRQEESTVVGSLAYRKNPTKGKDESPYLITHVPTGLSITGRSILSSLSDVTRFLKGMTLSGVDLSKPAFEEAERAKMLEAIVAFRGGAVPSWFSPAKDFGSANTVFTKKAKDKAVKNIGGTVNMGGMLNPAILKDVVTVGGFYVEGGVRSFAEFSAKMIEEFGAGVQKYIRPAYEALRKRTDIDTSGMDPEEGGETAPKAPEPEAPKPPPAEPPPHVEPPPPPAPAASQPAPLEGPVSVANEPLNKVAEIIGLPRIETPLDGPYRWPQAWEDARAEFEQNPRRGEELVKGMIARPRPPTPLEEVILLREGVTRTNAFNAAVDAQSKASAADQEAANQRVADATNALAEIQQASALMGTLSGRALNFRKMSAWMDFSLANMVTRLQWGKQKELTKEEIKDAQDTHKKITKIEEDIAKTASSAGAEAELTSIFEETFKEAMALTKKNANDLIIQSRSAAKQGKSMKDFLVEKREEARKRIRMRGNNLNMGLNPADLFDHAVIMASYIAEGVVSLADLTAKMIGDFGPNVGKHIPQIKKEADALLEAEQQVFEKPEEGTTKSYAEQLVESKGEDLSDRWVYNRVKEWLVEQGEAGLKKDTKVLLDEVFKVITKEVNAFDPSITEQQLRDMFSGYGKVKFPNPEAAAVKLRQMRRLELLLDKLERARAGVAPLRAGLQRDETTSEERAALKLLNQTMKDLDIQRAPSGANIKTPLDAVKSRLKNSIEDLNKQIEKRKRTERPRKDVAYDDEAKALETERDNLQERLDEIDPPRPPTVGERITARLKDLDKQIADLRTKVAAKDYKPKQNETPITEQIQVRVDERDALSQTLKELRIEAEGLPVLTQEQVNERAQRTLTRQIDELEKQIREKDFAPDATLKPEASPALSRLKTKVEALRKQRDQLKEDLGFRRKQKTDDELIDSAVASLEKTIDKLNKQINDGDLSSKARPSKVPEVAKIKNLRAERDSLREEVQRLRKAKEDAAKDPVAEKIKADRKQLQRMIKGYEDRIAKGDFRKRPKIAKVYDDSLMQLEIDLDNIKAEWSRKVFEAHLASRPPLKRMLDTGGQILNTSRAVLTSFDLSAVLRQGGFIGLGNPFRAAKNITPMLRAFASDDVAKASLKRLKQRDNWRNYVASGLYIAETDQAKMSAQEEAFMSRWIDKIPSGAKGLFLGSIVRGSQRAYLTFLNNLRADTFDALVNQLQKGPTPTREEMESIAYYINTATGRGDLGKGALNQGAVLLNTVFFAPRLVASRFQIIGGMPIFKATGRTKALVLQEYAKFLMGASIVYALAGLAQDDDDEPLELDPRSSDFLKVRYRDTRVDPLGGLIQATVFVSRVVAGETKSAKGKITPIRDTMRLPNLFREVPRTDKVPYGGRNVFNLAADFARTKFSPAFGGAVDIVTGENVIGEAVTPADVAMKMTVPMSFEEAAETLEAHGMPKGPALTVLMTFGAGVMTYNDRK